MLDTKTLMEKAAAEIVKVFGKSYLIDNYKNSCQSFGFIDERTFQLFVGIKGSKDLPDRESTEKGWVVYGKVLLDALTGTVQKTEYVLE